ncbi:MAG: hypothetical protein KDB03_03900 [Planctomycetales bacterium]|nr:hypothetical protein [Planctomycetales bacterium]
MDGYGYTKDLSGDATSPVDGVMIFHGNQGLDGRAIDGRGQWATLRPGHGVGFASDGTTNNYSDRFGVELTFARRLQELSPGANIAIIKYSRGGTSIAADATAATRFGCWEPDFHASDEQFGDVNQYDHFLATVRNALSVADIDGDGVNDDLRPTGIVWMQGESDAGEEQVARRYEANLKRLMDLIRASLRQDDVRVVIGRISDSRNDVYDTQSANGKVWDFGEIVREAQSDFVAKDENAALVTSTDNYGYSDPWHYDSPGYLDLGRQFADAMFPK